MQFTIEKQLLEGNSGRYLCKRPGTSGWLETGCLTRWALFWSIRVFLIFLCYLSLWMLLQDSVYNTVFHLNLSREWFRKSSFLRESSSVLHSHKANSVRAVSVEFLDYLQKLVYSNVLLYPVLFSIQPNLFCVQNIHSEMHFKNALFLHFITFCLLAYLSLSFICKFSTVFQQFSNAQSFSLTYALPDQNMNPWFRYSHGGFPSCKCVL